MLKASQVLVRQKSASAISAFTHLINNKPKHDEYSINFTVNHDRRNINLITTQLNFNEQSTILAKQIALYKTRYPCYTVHEFHS